MSSVSVVEFKRKLSALLNNVEHGEDVVITRRGKPIARLTSLNPGHDRERARNTIAGLRAASRGLSLGSVTLRELIDCGRP